MDSESYKVIIVEGITDKKQVKKVMIENVTIICTHGTLGVERFDDLLEKHDLDHKEVYLLVDNDEPGDELRNQLIRELPHAIHLHIDQEYREVAATPENKLATMLANNHFEVNPFYLRL